MVVPGVGAEALKRALSMPPQPQKAKPKPKPKDQNLIYICSLFDRAEDKVNEVLGVEERRR